MNHNKLIYIFKKIIKIIMYIIISFLVVLSIFIAYYVVTYKMAEKNNVNPPFGLLTAIGKSMEPTIKEYDVLLIKKTSINKLKKGDIITFLPSSNLFAKTAITHRINKIEKDDIEFKIITKGDSNDTIDSNYVYEKDIYGKVILIIPKIGKIQTFIANDGSYLIIILLSALVIISYDIMKLIKFFVIKKRNKEINEEF